MDVISTTLGLCRITHAAGSIVELSFVDRWDPLVVANRVDSVSLPFAWVLAVRAAAAGHGVDSNLPLAPQGTVFQQKVWQAIRRIPHGETCNYGQIAAAIGLPNAVRAVGTACGRNPIALLIPCHRVVRKDGAPGAYAWGLERKRHLLKLENMLF